MGSQGMFDGSIAILKRNLDFRSIRHNLIVSNIANKDTPKYKAFDLAVEAAMQKTEGNIETVTLEKTHAAHMTAEHTDDMHSSIRQSNQTNPYEKNHDGNTVDIEKEMAHLAENNLMYETMTQIIRKKFQGLKSVIQGGGR